MNKATLLQLLCKGFRFLPPNDYELLTRQLAEIGKDNNLNDEEMAAKIEKEMPKLKLLHRAAMRHYINKMSEDISTIKILIIIYFVLSILAAVVILSTQK